MIINENGSGKGKNGQEEQKNHPIKAVLLSAICTKHEQLNTFLFGCNVSKIDQL